MHTAIYYFEDGKYQSQHVKIVVDTCYLGMRKVKPYYFEYKSFAKGRWLGRPILEVFSSEFRDRSIDYYVSCSNLSLQYLLNKSFIALCN